MAATHEHDEERPAAEPAGEPLTELDLRRLGRQMVLGLLLLMGLIGLTAWIFRQPLLAISMACRLPFSSYCGVPGRLKSGKDSRLMSGIVTTGFL